MRITLNNKVTLPKKIIDELGIVPGKTEVEFSQKKGCWYLVRANPETKNPGRFRTAHKVVKLTLSSEKFMALTRNSHIHE